MKQSHGSDSSRINSGALPNLDGILDQRPILVALAGPNGAGKTTFFHSYVKPAGLRFLNADEIARELEIDAYEAARVVTQLRRELVKQRESFVFETVFSDPVGDKLKFLCETANSGYAVVLCFIGLAGPETCEQRVAIRVSQGGHDVPSDKLVARFPRTMANLKRAISQLPLVMLFDNDDLRNPFRQIALFMEGLLQWTAGEVPEWASDLVKTTTST